MLSDRDRYLRHRIGYQVHVRERMGLVELLATTSAALGVTEEVAQAEIRKALVAGVFQLEWANPHLLAWTKPPPFPLWTNQPPPERDPLWLTAEINWRTGLVFDDFDRVRGAVAWRELLVSRRSVHRWLQELAAVQTSRPVTPGPGQPLKDAPKADFTSGGQPDEARAPPHLP